VEVAYSVIRTQKRQEITFQRGGPA
jgi:hypothetical protein